MLVGLVASGVALASGLACCPVGPPCRGRWPGGPWPTARPEAGLRLLREAAQACRSLSYQGVEVAWWGPGSQAGGDFGGQVWHQPGGQALTQDPGAQVLTQTPPPC